MSVKETLDLVDDLERSIRAYLEEHPTYTVEFFICQEDGKNFSNGFRVLHNEKDWEGPYALGFIFCLVDIDLKIKNFMFFDSNYDISISVDKLRSMGLNVKTGDTSFLSKFEENR